jgi:hypothetical protein
MRFPAGSRTASWALSKIRSKYALDTYAVKGADGAKVSHEGFLPKKTAPRHWQEPMACAILEMPKDGADEGGPP